MTPDDLVTLVIVTPTNCIPISPMTREVASEVIRGWYVARETYSNYGLLRRLGLKIRDVWKLWTFAGAVQKRDGQEYTSAAVGCEHIVGMYIAEGRSTNEKLARAQLRVLRKMEKEQSEEDRWKQGPDEEDNDDE